MRSIPLPETGVVNRSDVIRYFHKVTTTTGGTIGSQTAVGGSGVVAGKTATEGGRYTLTLNGGETYGALLFARAAIIGADDAAYAAAAGIGVIVRDNDIDGGALDGTVEIQFIDSATNADAEVADGAIILFEVVVQRGKVQA